MQTLYNSIFLSSLNQEIMAEIKETKDTKDDTTIARDQKKAAESLDEQYTLKDWANIERKLSDYLITVLKTISSYKINEGSFGQQHTICMTIGEKLYVANRHKLSVGKLGKLVFDNKINKADKKEKAMSKKDKIIFDNSNKKATNEFDSIIKTFSDKSLITNSGLENNIIVEIKGITFMYAACFMICNKTDYMKKSKLRDVYELITGIQRFIGLVTNLSCKSLSNPISTEFVSQTMIDDLKYWLDKLVLTFDFDGLKIHEVNPKLFVCSKYDSCMPTYNIKPRKNQKEMFDFITNYLDNEETKNNGFMMFLKAMTNSGKTTSSIWLANKIKHMRDKSGGQDTTQLLFCCNLRSVQDEVATICYNNNIKFARAFMRQNNGVATVRIVNHNTCKNDSERIVIICSPKIAAFLLKDKTQKYWLFLDEPTMGSDQKNSQSLINNIETLINMPKYTILSSATMPDESLIPNIVKHYKDQWPSSVVKTIYSNEIHIGCEVKTFKGEQVVPHLGCKTVEDLKLTVENIEKNPFLGRLYTHKIVPKLYFDVVEIIKDLPDMRNIFSNVDNISMEKMRILAIDILKKMVEYGNNSLIERVCSTSIDVTEKVEKQEEELMFEDELKEQQIASSENIDFSKLGTFMAYKFMNTNLVFTDSPVEFATKQFQSLLADLKTDGFSSSDHVFKKYERDLELHQKKVDRISVRVKNQDNASKEIQDMDKPILNFPDWAHINTLDHIRKYAKTHGRDINPQYIRSKYCLEMIPRDSRTINELMLLLMCGVGIYSLSDSNIDDIYRSQVMSMAATGQLAYLIADSSFSFGANYPISRVFIMDDFAENHSIDTIFQSLSRAGRVGHSWMAEAYVCDKTANMTIRYSRELNNGYGVIEARNMEEMFKTMMTKTKDDEIIKIQKETEKQDFIKKIEAERITDTKIISISEVTKKQNWAKDVDTFSNSKSSTQNQKPLFSSGSMADTSHSWRPKDSKPREEKKIDKPKPKYVPPHMRAGDSSDKEQDKPKEDKPKESVKTDDNSGWTTVKSSNYKRPSNGSWRR
jgi:hypothetical protein